MTLIAEDAPKRHYGPRASKYDPILDDLMKTDGTKQYRIGHFNPPTAAYIQRRAKVRGLPLKITVRDLGDGTAGVWGRVLNGATEAETAEVELSSVVA